MKPRYRVTPERPSPELPAPSGTLASGAESADILVAHGLGVVPRFGGGLLEDGTWSHQFGVRKGSTWDATHVSFRFLNHGPNSGSAVFKFWLWH